MPFLMAKQDIKHSEALPDQIENHRGMTVREKIRFKLLT